MGAGDLEWRHPVLPLPNFFRQKLGCQHIAGVAHHVQLRHPVVVMMLYILIDVKQGVFHVGPIVPNIWICEALLCEGHSTNLTP